MKAILQTKIINTPLRVNISNKATINTKRTRPVIIHRENIDTPPVITDHVRELARLIRNTNSLVKLYTIPGLIMPAYETAEDYTRVYLSAKARSNEDKPTYISQTKTPRQNRPAYKMHFITGIGNIRHKDKPAFRHDSMFLFDTLSEDYNA